MKIILPIFLFLTLQLSVFAQSKKGAFEEISVAASVQKNINQNYFHEYWEGGTAFQVDTETSFYAGNFFIDLKYDEFKSLIDDVPGFKNFQFSTGWGIREELFNRVEVGGSVGALFSMYYYEEVSEERKRWVRGHLGSLSPENESGFIFEADVSYAVSDDWGIRFSVSRSIVYTHSKVKLNYAGIGIYHALDTPKWLYEVLK